MMVTVWFSNLRTGYENILRPELHNKTKLKDTDVPDKPQSDSKMEFGRSFLERQYI